MNRSPQLRRRWRSRAAVVIAVVVVGASAVQSAGQQEQQTPQVPPTFRIGTNVIRVDATVIDRHGNPVPSLTAADFEVREDGKHQNISSFRFISADGQPSDDRSLPIRSQQHAATEAARDDVRTFLIFWDEYHIEQFVSASSGRTALTRAVLDQFGPTDLVAIMDPLTPTSAIEFTRDRRALADQIRTLQGRSGVYFPPRSGVEEEHLRNVRQPEQVEIFRSQVTMTAIKSAAAYLGTLREGRKTLIVVTEGLAAVPSRRPGMREPPAAPQTMALTRYADEQSTAIEMIRVANDSNTAIHIVDPRGLQVSSPAFGMLETLAHGSGGELHTTNDIPGAFRRIVGQASATYLLGYARDLPMDGRFHEIKVRVKRGDLSVRARAGYWAPRAEDVERAKKLAAAAVLPAPVATAFAALASLNAPRLADVWVGTRPLPGGRVQVTLAWTPRERAPGGAVPRAVAVTVKAGTEDQFETRIEPGGTTFEAPTGVMQMTIRVVDGDGEIIDRESRTLELSDSIAALLAVSTPILSRARTPAELRAILGSAKPPVHAGREFVRTDRLIVRVGLHGASAATATIAATLMDRRGATLFQLPVQRAAAGGGYQFDLPLASFAAGEFLVAVEAQSGAERAEALLPFRVVK